MDRPPRARVSIGQAEDANDDLPVLGLSGADRITPGFGLRALLGLRLDGGTGGDRLTSDDTILGGTENDTIFGGPGDDSIDSGLGRLDEGRRRHRHLRVPDAGRRRHPRRRRPRSAALSLAVKTGIRRLGVTAPGRQFLPSQHCLKPGSCAEFAKDMIDVNLRRTASDDQGLGDLVCALAPSK